MNEQKDQNEIWITEFTNESAIEFRTNVLYRSKKDPYKPIIVYINSPGGSAAACAAMIDTINTVPNKIITVAIGSALSCGAILLSHGDARMITRHSEVMIHRVSTLVMGDVSMVKSRAKNLEDTNKLLNGLLANNCGLTFEELESKLVNADGNEIWLNAEDAVKFGIADYIGLPEIVSVIDYEVSIITEKPLREPITENNIPKRRSRKKS